MSGLENLSLRLKYQGGNQEGRLIKDKQKSLNKALLYSYQAETAVLADGREFRCLINPDKLKNDYDNKIISIPFKDICLNADKKDTTEDGKEEIGMKAGDVFEWKETETYWLVYLQRLEENAYFRAEIRKCRYEVEIGDNKYKIYLCGPAETAIVWHTKKNMAGSGISWNDLNYDLTMYITKDDVTEEFFHRFAKVKINGKTYEVQAVDAISVEGIIEVALKEDYTNSIQDEIAEGGSQAETPEDEETTDPVAAIKGPEIVYPYDEVDYTIENTSNGEWIISNNKAYIMSQTDTNVKLMIKTGRSGQFDLIYRKEDEEDIVLHITIDSL
jgi:hypothetical protein